MVKNHVENKNWREINPTSWHSPHLNEPLHKRILSSDPETGAMTSIVDLPKTTISDQILAANCELQIFVLEGELHFDKIYMKPGDYCYYPENSAHGKWRAKENTRLLLITDKTLEFFKPEDTSPDKRAKRQVDSWAMEWTNPLDASDPSKPYRQGLMVKVLHKNEATGASTHLAGLMPGWYAHGLEVHPIYEENYCLSGDVNIGEVDGGDGYTMTEGCYLCRPPGIPHGPISSKNGNVNFCYTPSILGIDYEPIENDEQYIFSHLRSYPWR